MASKKRDRRAVIGFASVLLGFAALLGWATNRIDIAVLTALALGVGIPLAFIVGWCLMLVPLAIHEAGHWAAGRAANMKCRYFQVGAYAIVTTDEGRKVRRVGPLQSTNGYCHMIPVDGRRSPGRIAFMILGGPLASIALLLGVLLVESATGVWSSPNPILILVTVWVAAPVASSVIPFRIRGQRTDASQLIALGRGDEPAAAARSIAINQIVASGQRARDWDQEVIKSYILEAKEPREILFSNLLGFYASWDSGEPEQAMERITTAAAVCIKPLFFEAYRELVYYEYAYALAQFRHDVDWAKSAFDRGVDVEAGVMRMQRYRAEAAIALAEGKSAGAIRLAELAIAEVRREHKVVTPAVQAEIDWNEEIIAAAKAVESPP